MATATLRAFRPVRLPVDVKGSDARLAGMSRRDPDTIKTLHRECGPAVLGFLRRALRDPGAAEDVFQQVFLEAWQRAPEYDPARGTPITWLMTIARSRAIDHMRRRLPEPRDPAGTLALLEGEPDPAGSIDALVEQWRVAHLLGQLPAAEADMLRRRFYRGQSQREIAADTGVPLGTVKMRMVQALTRLRGLIEEEGDAP